MDAKDNRGKWGASLWRGARSAARNSIPGNSAPGNSSADTVPPDTSPPGTSAHGTSAHGTSTRETPPPPARDTPPREAAPDQPGEAVPWSLRIAAAWAGRVIVVGVAFAGLVYLLWVFRLVTISIFVALLLTALMQPGVGWLRRLGAPRLLATLVVFFGGIALVGGLFYLLGSLLAAGLSNLSATITEGIRQAGQWLQASPLSDVGGIASVEELTQRAQQWVSNNSQRLTQGALATVSMTARILTGLLLALIVCVFFLYDGARIWRWVVRLFPAGSRDRIDGAGRSAWGTLAGYVQGTIIVALFDGVLITVILVLVGLPTSLALPLGVLVFFGAFVPLVGAFVTGVLAVLVALLTQGFIAGVIVLAGIVAVQQLEGNVLQPFVVGRMMRLHPLAVLLAVTAGAIVGGIAGVVVAVPLAAVVNAAASYFARTSAGGSRPEEQQVSAASGASSPESPEVGQ